MVFSIRMLALTAGLGALSVFAPDVRAGTFESFERESLPGHSVEVFPDGESTHRARLELIRSARRSVYIATYAFRWDAAGREIAEALCARAREGVDVRIAADSFGSAPLQPRRDWLRSCGISIVFHSAGANSLENLFRTAHEKLLIADGEQLIIGGSGYGDHYRHASRFSESWHDIDSRMSGPVACWFQRKFGENWKKLIATAVESHSTPLSSGPSESWVDHYIGLWEIQTCKERRFGSARVLPTYNNPRFTRARPNLRLLLEALRSAERQVTLFAPYFVPHPDLSRELIRTAKRGVKVVVITNSPWSNDDLNAVVLASLQNARKLIKGGVEVRIWNPKSTFHRKGGLIDDRVAYFGSDNLDLRGQNVSSESVSYTDDPEAIATLAREMREDIAMSTALTRKWIDEYLKKKGLWKNWLARIVHRYL